MGNRVAQTAGGVVTRYLLDVQPGLVQRIAATTDGMTERYLHGMTGIHAMENSAGVWHYAVADGLGNVRTEVDANGAVLGARSFTPYLEVEASDGTFGMPFAVTGEPTDFDLGLVHLRARDYAPGLGVFTARDPWEGTTERAMSLNGYSWVDGNVVNAVDPSGMFWDAFRKLRPEYRNAYVFQRHQQSIQPNRSTLLFYRLNDVLDSCADISHLLDSTRTKRKQNKLNGIYSYQVQPPVDPYCGFVCGEFYADNTPIAAPTVNPKDAINVLPVGFNGLSFQR